MLYVTIMRIFLKRRWVPELSKYRIDGMKYDMPTLAECKKGIKN